MDKDVWNVVSREKAISEGANIIDTVWALNGNVIPMEQSRNSKHDFVFAGINK